MSTFSIQSSFEVVIRDVLDDKLESDEFWINIMDTENLEDGKSKEERVRVSKENEKLQFKNDNGLVFQKKGECEYTINYENSQLEIRSPSRKLTTGVKNTTSFDISPNQQLYLAGDMEGKLTIGRTIDSSIERTIEEAHFAEITKSIFFPSGKVALTTSLDLSIKVWDVSSGSNPRTFKSHKARITDLAMIDNGRNFVSSSLDGYIKLWDCGSGTNISSFKRQGSLKDGITSLFLHNGDQENVNQVSKDNLYEFGTNGKQLLAGHFSGVISIFDLGTKDDILSLPSLDGQVVSLYGGDGSSISEVLSSYDNGVVAKWDIRSPRRPLAKVKLGSNLDCISLKGGIVISSSDFGTNVKRTSSEDLTKTEYILAGIEDSLIGFKSISDKTLYANTSSGDIYEFY